jgi:TolA protein
MTESTLPDRPTMKTDEDLSLGLKWSFIGHGAILLLILVQTFVFPGKVSTYIPTLKVDLVGLPDILKKDLALPNQKQLNQEIQKVLKKAEQHTREVKPTKTVKELVQKDEMTLNHKATTEKTVEKKNKRALDRHKALSKIQEFSESETTPQKKVLIKGNKISPGASLSGEAREALEASYLDLLRDRLQENWTLPPWVARQNHAAQVQIYLDAQGHLHHLKFIKASGSAQFDEAVKRAVDASQPFPLPPKDLARSLLVDGILVGFPL